MTYRSPPGLVAILLMATMAGASQAGVSFEKGPLGVAYEDGRDASCAVPDFRLECVAEYDVAGSGLADDSVEFTPNATVRATLSDVLGNGITISVTPQRLRVEQPVVGAYDSVHDTTYPDALKPYYDWDPNPENQTFRDVHPAFNNGSLALNPYSETTGYSGPFNYTTIGVPYHTGTFDLDDSIGSEEPCGYSSLDSITCTQTLRRNLQAVVSDHLPEVRLGTNVNSTSVRVTNASTARWPARTAIVEVLGPPRAVASRFLGGPSGDGTPEARPGDSPNNGGTPSGPPSNDHVARPDVPVALAARMGARAEGRAAVAATAAAAATAALAALVALALRHRLRDQPTHTVVAASARKALLAAAAEQPGATVSALAKRAGVSHNNASYHVRVLEKRGLVVLVRRDGPRSHQHVYLAHQAPAVPERTVVLALENPTARAVREAVERAPTGLRIADVANAVGVPVSAARFHVRRLEADGLVQRARDGPGWRVLATPPALAPTSERRACATGAAIGFDGG